MTTPHHSEPAREAVALPSEITEAQINSACLSYRHDFGLLDEYDKERLRIVAKEWLHAWRKEFTPMAPALKLAASPAPAASGGLEALPHSILTQWHLDNWTDNDFREHVPATRKTIAALYAALAAPAATGGEDAEEAVWLRDLDGTGSMHVCSKGDAGAVEYVPAPAATFGLRSHMAYIAAYDPDELNGGKTPEGQRAAMRLRTIIERARTAVLTHPAPSETATGGEAVATVVWYDPRLDPCAMTPRRIVDPTAKFISGAALGTKLYTHPAPSETGASVEVKEALEAADAVLTGEDGCNLDPIVGSHNPNEHAAGLVRAALARGGWEEREKSGPQLHPNKNDPGHWRWRGE